MHSLTHLIAFAGDENTDPITPAFDKRLGIREVILLHGPRFSARASALAKVVRDAGIGAHISSLPHLHRPEGLEAALAACLSRWRERAIINLSGASPVVAALVLRMAERQGLPVCTVEPNTDRLHWISAPPHFASFDVADRITLVGYFAAHGLSIVSTEVELGDPPGPFEQIAGYLLQLACQSPKVIDSFRALMSFHADGFLTKTPGGAARNVADYLVARQLLERKGDRLFTANSAVRRFLSGGWLELAIYRQTLALFAPGAPQDAAAGLKFASVENVENELDVVILHNNALFACECKSHATRSDESGIGPEVLFKLDSIAKSHGLAAKPLLVTTMPPTPMELARAQDQEILVLGGATLEGMRETLSRWLGL